MKIRIKGASVRLRLSKTEVAQLVRQGLVEDETHFETGVFRYALQKADSGTHLSATFEDGKIIMYVPDILVQDWDTNETVSIEAHMPVGGKFGLYLLLEKDFQCVDETTEDQTDNYLNPNQIC